MSLVELLVAAVLVVAIFGLLPHVVIPAVAEWQQKRRGARPQPAGAWTIAGIAAMLAALAVAVSWDSEANRPSVAVLLTTALGAVVGLWLAYRRR